MNKEKILPMKKAQLFIVVIIINLMQISLLAQNQWVNGPEGGYIRDLIEHENSYYAMSNTKLFRSDNNAQSWQELDMSQFNYNVFFFEFEANDNYLFLSASTGLFRSNDSGETWQKIHDEVTRYCVYGSTVFVISGNDDKVYRSMDNGETWVQKHSPILDNTPWYDMGEFSFDGNLLFLGSVYYETALYRSEDLGETWSHITNGLEDPYAPEYYVGPKQLLFTDDRLLLATWYGIYHSTDDGLNWEPMLYDEENGCEKLFQSADLILARGYNNQKFWKSMDATNWEDITNNIPLSLNTHTLYAITPYSASETKSSSVMETKQNLDETTHLFATGQGIHITPDNLNTTHSTDNLGLIAWTTEPSMIVSDESYVYASASSRIFKTNDIGITWELIYEGIDKLRKSNAMLWGTSGSSDELVHYSVDGGSIWSIIYNEEVYQSEDGGVSWNIIANDAPANITWMAELNGSIICTSLNGIYKSNDGGVSWENKSGNIGYWKIYATESSLFANCISNDQRGIHRSTDNGETWTNIGLGDAVYFNWDLIEHNGTLFAGVDYTDPRGVWRSTDNGDSWEHVHVGTNFRKFELNESKIYFSAYNENTQLNHIYVSADNGSTWNEVTSTAYISTFTVNNQYVFIPGSADQVLRSGNDGGDWQDINQGEFMFRPRINGLRVLNNGLYVGTMRSAYYVLNLSDADATVITLFADDINENGALLYGSVNANGSSCIVSFEYGESTNYGHSVDAEPHIVTGSTPITVNAAINDLTPQTTYNYRTVAINGNGTYYGENRTFTTTMVGFENWIPSDFIVYPNPFNDYINLRDDGFIDRIEICTISGLTLIEQSSDDSGIINTNKLVPGVYLLKLYSNKGVCHIKKIIKL